MVRTMLSENRRTLSLAVPIISGHLGQMLMGWVDAVLVGRVGVVPLAAVFSVWLPTARADLETARVEAQGVTAYQAWLPVMRSLTSMAWTVSSFLSF